MMCFENEYSCTISCINSELDMSALANGTIKRVGEFGVGCKAYCGEAVMHTDAITPSFPTDFPTIPIVMIALCVIVGAIALYLHFWVK